MPLSSPRARWAVLLIALSLAYTAAMFRGLEGHTGYSGCAYQAIYPGSFPGDPFMPADRPVMLSLYYLLVHWAGPIWLDDRFTFFVFAGMALFSLVALDKTARLLGASLRMEQAAILAFILLEHRFFITHILLVDNYGFSGTGLGAAAALWLLLGALAGWGPGRQIPLMALCLAISMKNTWIPVIGASVLLWKDRLGPAMKRWSLLGILAGAAGGLAFYYGNLRPTDGNDVRLFDYILNRIDDAEANPFLYPLWANGFFAAFCGSAFFLRGLPAEVLKRVRVIAVIGLAVWLLSGLYLSYAPDALKIPYLVPFDPRRALRWPSYVIFLGWGVFLLKRFQEASGKSLGLAGGAFFGLYLFLHEQPRPELAVLILMVCGFLLLKQRGALTADRKLRLLAVPVVVGTLSLYAVGAIRHRWEALSHLVRTGIMGDNLCAKWAGVNEYLREKSDPAATVLALSMEDTHRNPAPLQFDASLRTRAGRTMPMAHPAAFYLDYPKLQWWEERSRRMAGFSAAWDRQDLGSVTRDLPGFGPPDYLVIPTRKSGWVEGLPGFNYRVDARVGEFTIFRRHLS